MNGEGLASGRNDKRAEELTWEKKEKMKGRWMGWIDVLLERQRERDWWLTQACKELRAAETD